MIWPLHAVGGALGLSLMLVGSLAACEPSPGSTPTQVPQGAAQATISLQEIECQSCGMSVVTALERTAGVHSVAFDRASAEVKVAYDPALVAPAQFIAVAHDLGYRASEGPGQGAYTPEVEFPEALDVVQISKQGEAVELAAFVVPGKVTVFDFHALWCGPCKQVDRHMLSVLKDNDDVALRKLNIVDWDSPVTKQYLTGAASLPFVIVYGRDGKRVAKITGLELDKLDAAIDKGRR